jgi:predicted porin
MVAFGATTVGAQFANNTADRAKALELFANYNLSKRSFLYANYVRGTFTNNPGVSTSTITDLNRIALGIQHSF